MTKVLVTCFVYRGTSMNIRIKQKILIILCSITISVMFCSCSILPDDEQALAPPIVKAKETEYQTYKVVKKDITQSIKGVGNLISMVKKNLSFIQSGTRIKTINVEVGQKVKKGDILIVLDIGNLPDDIKKQENLIKKAQIKLDDQNSLLKKYTSLPKDYQPSQKELDDVINKIKVSEIDLNNAKMKLSILQRRQSLSVLTAPINGIVTSMEKIKPGDTVEANKEIITITSPEGFYLYYQVVEKDISMIKKGMKADVTYDGKKYEGQVVKTQEDSSDELDMKGALLISINNLPSDARLGGVAELVITTESRKNAIVIPKKALRNFNNNKVVQILDGESKKQVDVKTGLETTDEVEILSGLDEGQNVILN